MIPYTARRDISHAAGATQLVYSPLPHAPIYEPLEHQQQLQPSYQFQPGHDPNYYDRPLFRTLSVSSPIPTQCTKQENLLRRKTPSGTLPAAYDAAPMEFAQRPTKHIMLPYQGPMEPQTVYHDSHKAEWGTKMAMRRAGALRLQGAVTNTNAPTFLSPWSIQNGVQASSNNGLDPYVRQFLLQQQIVPPHTDPVWANYQPLGFQPTFNPIPAPTASYSETYGYVNVGNMGLTPRDLFWQPDYAPSGGSHASLASQLPQAVNHMHLNTQLNSDCFDPTANIWPNNHSRPDSCLGAQIPQQFVNQPMAPSLQCDTSSCSVFGHANTFTNAIPQHRHQHPRERIATWAYKAYVELLAFVQAHNCQSNHSGLNSTTPSKTSLFPRPPKVNITRNAPGPPQDSYGSSQYGISDPNFRRKRACSNMGSGYLNPGAFSSQPNLAEPGFFFPGSEGQLVYDNNINGSIGLISGSGLAAAYETGASAMNCYSNGIQTRRGSAPISNGSSLNVDISLSATNLRNKPNPTAQAKLALETLDKMCSDSNWAWLDGMLLGGCLAFGLGDLNRARSWYLHVLQLDEGHVETLSNLASALLSLNRRGEAEQYWRRAVKKQPSYLEAVEHLVGLLCGDQRGTEAVDVITFVERSLRRPRHLAQRTPSLSSTSSEGSLSSTVADMKFDYEDHETDFMIPGSDNGRMVALIHAKGNMLYTLGDNAGAAKAFEDAVLVATGISSGGIQALINKILAVLMAAMEGRSQAEVAQSPPQTVVLLAPDKAILTAKLVFPPNGRLPGLAEVHGAPEKAAISTTSNSLLSLAKIFQDGMSSGGGAARTGASVKEILALYYLSLALQPSPSTANNVGILLASIQQQGSSVLNVPGGVLHPPGISPGTGVSLALAYYYYGLNLDYQHAHLYTNLGSLLKDINQLPAAIKMYEQAVACDGTFDIALANLANAVKDQGRIGDAIVYYKRAVKANPDFAEAVCGLANALNSVCDWKGRGGVIRDAGNRDRWHVDDNGMLWDAKATNAVSSGWMQRVVEIVEKQLVQGEAWGKGALTGENLDRFLKDIEYAEGGRWSSSRYQELQSAVAEWIGKPYEGSKIIQLIERASQRAVWRWYQDKYQKGIDHPSTEYHRPMVPAVLTTPSAPTVLPFHTFTCPLSTKQVRLISERNGLRISCSALRSAWLPEHVYPPPAPPAPYLRVGYVSSDFNNHPLAHLMQSVFGLHDLTRVKAYCYATTASDNSEHRRQIEAESPVFHDAHNWGPDRLIRQIVEDGIHILVNLNGFTRGARNEVFAARPAPIQMSFMGFAGTLGAQWCDYLYADTTAVPPEMLRATRQNIGIDDVINGFHENEKPDWIYAENIIFARYTFFCCDHRQSAPDSKSRQLSWDEETKRRWDMRKIIFPDLTDDQVILGNFNQLYKIEPTIFRTWLRILQAVPNTILWLLRFPELGEANLLSLAETWASSEVAKRIIFTDVAPKPEHISRAQVCDLFLDTPECNAHTTAADVLWSGTPLLTLPRHKHKMCSRIAASILRAAVPQTEDGRAIANSLVADSEADYENRAIEFTRGLRYDTSSGDGKCTGELADIRKVLFTSRWRSELFNTKRWVRDLEDAYEVAWRRWVDGVGGDIDLKTIKPSY